MIEQFHTFRMCTQLNQMSEQFYSTISGLTWEKTGSLLLATSRDVMEMLETYRLNDFNNIHGFLLSPDDTLEVFPYINPEGLYGSAYFPGDGYINPTELMTYLRQMAVDNNVFISENTNVEDFTTENEEVKVIHTSSGDMRVKNIVIASGIWTNGLLEKLNYFLPMTVIEQERFVSPKRKIMPIIRDLKEHYFISGFHGGMTISSVEDVSTYEVKSPDNYIDRAFNRVPLLKNTPGEFKTFLRQVTLDGNPFIGKLPGYKNVYIATGSMNGVCCAGGIAQCIKKLLIDGEELRLPSFDPDRFEGYIPEDWEEECARRFINTHSSSM